MVLTKRVDGLGRCPACFLAKSTDLQHLAQAAEVPAVPRPQPHQVAEHRDRLVASPFFSRAWASSWAVSGRSDRAAM